MSGRSGSANRRILNGPPAAAWPPCAAARSGSRRGQLVQLDEPVELVPHELRAAQAPAQRRLVDDRPQPWPGGGEELLRRRIRSSTRRSTSRVSVRAELGDRAGVVAGLQQAGEELQLVGADQRRRLLEAEVGLEPGLAADRRIGATSPARWPAWRARGTPPAPCRRTTPYRESRSATSRSLNPTRPSSSRLIFAGEARIASPACSRVTPAASRRRRSWAPSAMRSTVGPPPATGETAPPVSMRAAEPSAESPRSTFMQNLPIRGNTVP